MTPQERNDESSTRPKRVLTSRAQALLTASDAERIAAIQEDRWIGYPKALDALAEMERLIQYPNTRRPPNLLLIAHTNNGKTTIAQRLQHLHPVIDDPAADGVVMPVVVLDAPSSPDEDRFYNHILNRLGAVFRIRGPKDDKLFQIQHLLRDIGMRVLVLDEVNNMLAGTATQRQQMFNAIKSLSNALERPIILTGTFDALVLVREDTQIQNRFPPFALPRWEYDGPFRQLLASFEATLPLKRASKLSEPELAALLLVMSQNVIGELRRLLTEASELAIKDKSERITRTLLRRMDWTPADQRDTSASAAEYGLEHKVDYRQSLDSLKKRGGEKVTLPDDVEEAGDDDQ